MSNDKVPVMDAVATTRRQVILGAAGVVGGIVTSSVVSAAAEVAAHSSEAIHQEVTFKASAKRVYEALTDAAQFDKVMHLSAAVQGGMDLGNKPTQIATKAGGAFSVFGGHIFGRQIELVVNKRIVQAWRVIDWAPGVYSIAKFEFTERGAETKLVFDHTGFPEGQGQHLAEGWKANYWEPLQKYLA